MSSYTNLLLNSTKSNTATYKKQYQLHDLTYAAVNSDDCNISKDDKETEIHSKAPTRGNEKRMVGQKKNTHEHARN